MVWVWFRFMVWKATFNNISVISWRSVLLLEETGESGENHRPVANHWQTLSHNVVSNTWTGSKLTLLVVKSTDCTGSCKSNYHTITTKEAPCLYIYIWGGLNIIWQVTDKLYGVEWKICSVFHQTKCLWRIESGRS